VINIALSSAITELLLGKASRSLLSTFGEKELKFCPFYVFYSYTLFLPNTLLFSPLSIFSSCFTLHFSLAMPFPGVSGSEDGNCSAWFDAR
jgi:hypothetical protein